MIKALAEIPADVFAGFSELKRVTIPAKVKTIGAGAFDWCVSLETVNTFACGFDGNLVGSIRRDKACGFHGAPRVKVIGHAAFSGIRLEKIALPDFLERIEGRAFFDNSYLKRVRVPAGVKYMAEDAFADCAILRSVDGSSYVKGVPKKYDALLKVIAKHMGKSF